MTKRFKKVIEGNFVLFYDGDEQIPFDEVVGVLNSLNDENEQLKSENDKFRSFIRRNHAIGMIHRILTGDVE